MDTNINTAFEELMQAGRNRLAQGRNIAEARERALKAENTAKVAAYLACLVDGMKSILPEALHPFINLDEVTTSYFESSTSGTMLRIPGFAPIYVKTWVERPDDGYTFNPQFSKMLRVAGATRVINWDDIEDAEKPMWSWSSAFEFPLSELPAALARAEELGNEYAQLEVAHQHQVEELRKKQSEKEARMTARAKEPTFEDRLLSALTGWCRN